MTVVVVVCRAMWVMVGVEMMSARNVPVKLPLLLYV